MSYKYPLYPSQCSYRESKFIQMRVWVKPNKSEIFKYYKCMLEPKMECERSDWKAGKRYCVVRNNE